MCGYLSKIKKNSVASWNVNIQNAAVACCFSTNYTLITIAITGKLNFKNKTALSIFSMMDEPHRNVKS